MANSLGLKRDHANGRSHVSVRKIMNALRGRKQIQPDLFAELSDCTAAQFRIDLHLAAQEVVGVEIAQDAVRLGATLVRSLERWTFAATSDS